MAKQRHDASQLSFKFDNASMPMQPNTPEHAAIVHAHLPPPVLPPIIPRRVTFDFSTTFPSPLADALDSGVFGSDVPDGSAVQAIHHEHANELLCILADLDAISDARIDGTDPRTGKQPRGVAAREKLDQFFRTEPGRLEGRFESLLEVYANAFGDDAAMQFESFVRSQHQSLEVESDFDARHRMPVPEPLPEAVEKGNFGMEDDQTPVDPSPEEVFAITEQQGERMVELLEQLKCIEWRLENLTGEQRHPAILEKDRTLSAFQGMLALYAEDFGDVATRRLEAWARGRIGVPTIVRPMEQPADADPLQAAEYGPGHPWHYLQRGDGQKPVPVEEIPPGPCDGAFVGKLPRDMAKRRVKLSQLLADQTRQLEEDKTKYREVAERGSQALSEYDRTIAYGGDDELAVASTLALKFNHISNGLGRVAWLREKVGIPSSASHPSSSTARSR